MTSLIPPQNHPSSALTYLFPLIDAYTSASYDSLRTAIFPGYFHGKCQVDGVDPEGCPNPDCPVVCGTPGSLVHFYTKLRAIAFNNTRGLLTELSSPDGVVYGKIRDRVMKDAERNTPRMVRVYGRAPAGDVTSKTTSHSQHVSYPNPKFSLSTRGQNVEKQLKPILNKIPGLLEKECGGTGKDGLEGLHMCNWENEMKAYILSFP
jgi:hypothetical protein